MLLRWRHPTLGFLHPGKFLKIAEDLGLIIPLGKWIFEQAAQTLQWLQSQGLRVNGAINISARQFADANFVSELLFAIQNAGINSSSVEIEITESLAMENLDRTRRKLLELKAQGITITVDDFGTGYSSLSYLKRLPIDKLKIDKSFVRHVITDEQDTSIIKAIISMANSLHLKVVAEGVDSEVQLHLLESLGCQELQGFFISRPLTQTALVDFIKSVNVPKIEAISSEKTTSSVQEVVPEKLEN